MALTKLAIFELSDDILLPLMTDLKIDLLNDRAVFRVSMNDSSANLVRLNMRRVVWNPDSFVSFLVGGWGAVCGSSCAEIQQRLGVSP